MQFAFLLVYALPVNEVTTFNGVGFSNEAY